MGNFIDSLKNRDVRVDEDLSYDKSLQAFPAESLKACLICGKPFVKKGRAVYCGRQHYTTCLNCGKRIDILPKHYYAVVPKTCSKECADTLGVQTFRENSLAKYGVSNPMYVPELVEKMVAKRNPDFDMSLKTTEQYRNCEVCGKSFRYYYDKPKRCCSEACSVALRRQTIESKPMTCKLCGKPFISSNGKSLYCPGPHYRDCVICGKPFELKSVDSTTLCCSAACTTILRSQTNLEKYGVSVASQSVDAKAKLSEAYYQSQGDRRATCLEKYGTDNPAKADDVRQKIAQTVASEACQQRIMDTCMTKYGVPHSSQVPEIHQKQWNSRKNIRGADGTPLDSTWEKTVYDFWLSLGLSIERNIPIQFEYNGKQHTTYIDFRVDGLLFEVKGKPYLDGVYDYKQSVPIEQKIKVYRENHVIMITDEQARSMFGHKDSRESNGLKHLDICPNPFIGVDVALFLDMPEFPYAANRPKCFYDVSVNGCPSQYQAFNNRKIRWFIIKNRIQYIGGFIDAKEILVGLNVTRKAKQPSWFSKALATRLIKSYCTSDVIVDPFAGWGTRHDATVKLGKTYYGGDFNRELVEWHREQGRSIIYANATDFQYAGPCSVFICPPYGDTEIYTTNQAILSECEWLDIVIRNIPNASEYVMVCHTVADKYLPYVVETKQNTSHFSSNTEYVIVVPQDAITHF